MILSDNETKIDLLNNETIAITIIKLLREHSNNPITIGVHGDWGAGKSSVLEMIENGLESDKKNLCLKFNSWRYQGFEDAKISLIEGIVNGLVEKRPKLKKMKGALKETIKRIDWIKVAKMSGGLAWTAITSFPTAEQIKTITSIIKGWLGNPVELATKENLESVIGELNGLIKPAEAKHIVEEIQEFRKAFDDLLKEAEIEQLVVLIDDLDRCLPETAIETLEAIRLFLFTEHTAFVVAADEAMIEYAVRNHFPELPATTGPRDYARNYLEKLIQIPFRIPALGETETRIYVALLLIGSTLGENDVNFQKLISVARDRLKQPWTSTAFDAATVKKVLGNRVNDVQDAIRLSDQIGPILANGTKGNPRQIKRFLNTILLRQRIADARGFVADVKLNVLAKLLLAERFLSVLFDHIANTAASSSDGRCLDIVELERSLQSKTLSKEKKFISRENVGKKDEVKEIKNDLVESWLSTESIRLWASIEPQLSEIDLRPYLFVAKERKDYFGDTSGLGRLALIADQLLGPKITVQGMILDLKKLSASEASQVFEEIRSKIMGNADFKIQPQGIDGLNVLVVCHPSLQPNLLDFLESLPSNQIGPWVVAGWGSAIKDMKSVQRFDRILEKWAAVSDNEPLKIAASGTLHTNIKKRDGNI